MRGNAESEASPATSRTAHVPCMENADHTRSPGIPIGLGLTAGGGRTGSTAPLDAAVTAAADALSDRYPGCPITIRFNSDRRSGGAWLQTATIDRIGANAEIGITCALHPDTGAIHMMVYLSDVGAADHCKIQHSVPDTAAALALIVELAVPRFDELVERVRGRQDRFFDQHVRWALRGCDVDGRTTLIFAEYTSEGRASLEKVARSTAKANRSFSSYQTPVAARIQDGRVTLNYAGSIRVDWADANAVELGTVYLVDGGQVTPIARGGKLLT